MSGRDPVQRLQGDLWRAKRQRDEARRAVDAQAAVLVELQAELIRSRLDGRLLRASDFDLFIGVHQVIDADGRVDLNLLEQLLTDLLEQRPELAAPPRISAAAR